MVSDKNRKNRTILLIITCIKYLFAIGVTVAGALSAGHWRYIIGGLVELVLIALISEFLVSKCKIAGIILNDILLFIYGLQYLVMFFARTFTTTVMIENLNSVEDQVGNFLRYGIGVALLVIFSFLPITRFFQTKKTGRTVFLSIVFTLAVLAEAGLIFIGKSAGSPWVNAVQTTSDYIEEMKYRKRISEMIDVSEDESMESLVQFYKPRVDDDRPKPESLPEKPNVVLILTEGLSQNVVDDDRNIMPEVSKLKQESIFFDHYYNHTFATYRAVSGQLYSGYQLDNLDENHLPSLQSILKDNGYHTIMINVEPYNPDFSGYLEAMGFDEVLTLYDGLRGLGNTIADVDAYKLIFETMQEQPSDTPFFLCIYTFGTHESLGSVDAIFGETEVKELDKFYNVDLAFGDFMDQFKNSDLYDNTVIVFTADHCTYGDKDFATYFSYRERIHTMLDQMPLMIYYKDVEPETIDVNGRNTLCLAPTLLDLLDISGENMFLGSSLFSNEHTGILETCTVIDRGMSRTEGGILRPYSAEEEEELMVPITEYFKVKLR